MIDNEVTTGFTLFNEVSDDDLSGYGCYLVKHLGSGGYYIGIGNILRKRITTNGFFLRTNIHKCRLLQHHYNDDPRIICYCKPTNTREEAFSIKQDLLDKYFGESFIYNKSPSAKSAKGVKLDDVTKANIKIFVNTPESKERMSKLHTGRKHTDEARVKMSLKSTGRKHTDKSKAKMSLIQTALVANGKTMSAEGRAKLSSIHRGKTISAEARAKMSLSRKTYFANKKANDGLEAP